MRFGVRQRTLCVTVVSLAAAGLGCLALSPASASEGGQELIPDPSAYCSANSPFGAQVHEADWTVEFRGVAGTAGANDWKCQYLVQASAPVGEDSITFPIPFTYSLPVDWAAMCAQQYAGSSASWAGGDSPTPWVCSGAPGAVYDQTETETGPVGRVG